MTQWNPLRSSPYRLIALALAALQLSAFAVTAVQPGSDDEVLEVLPAVTRSRPALMALPASVSRPADIAAAAQQARAAIAVARQAGDTRYWGRAQAALAPWWDRADAPADIAVLQATVQQGRHEFAASRKVLTAALARSPQHAQGWLNLAALDRLSARYADSLVACEAVERAQQPLYAAACRLETQSLQGQHQAAAQGLQALLDQSTEASLRSWLWSLLAEVHERSGKDATAADAYVRSLGFAPDLYTAIAYSDLLLRTGKTAQALQVLAPLPETDAVLVRQAVAWRRLGDTRWTATRSVLQERVAALRRRGDDPALHARELALAALWLDDDPPRALALARSNLLLQREPLDWWLGLQSARQAKDVAAQTAITDAIRDAGLQDVRLAVAGKPAKLPATGKAP